MDTEAAEAAVAAARARTSEEKCIVNVRLVDEDSSLRFGFVRARLNTFSVSVYALAAHNSYWKQGRVYIVS